MPLSRSIASYADIASILSTILKRQTSSLFTPINAAGKSTPGAARHWIQRANMLRVLLREQSHTNQCLYDPLRFGIADEKHTVLIGMNIPRGVLTDTEGQEIVIGSEPNMDGGFLEEDFDADDPDDLADAKKLWATMGKGD